jgi:hypothetical protein
MPVLFAQMARFPFSHMGSVLARVIDGLGRELNEAKLHTYSARTSSQDVGRNSCRPLLVYMCICSIDNVNSHRFLLRDLKQ